MGQVGLVRRRLVIARRGVRRGEDEPAHTRQTRRVEQTERLRDVDVEGAEGIGDGIGDPRPRREMNNRVHPRHRPRDGSRVRQWRVDELVRHAGEVRQPTDRQVVENPDALAALGEQPDEG